MKNILFSLLLLAAAGANAQDYRWYVGTNPLSPLAGPKMRNATLHALIPMFTNLEYGATLAGGWNFNATHSVEARLTLGKANRYNIIPQAQAIYHFYWMNALRDNGSGWYVGTGVRYFDYHSLATGVHRHNWIFPTLEIGHTWRHKRVFTDLRLMQMFGVYSRSSLDNTTGSYATTLSPMPLTLPVMPMLGLTVGYQGK